LCAMAVTSGITESIELASTGGFDSLSIPVMLIALVLLAVVKKLTNLTATATEGKENGMGEDPKYRFKQGICHVARETAHNMLWVTGAVGVEVTGAVLASPTKTLRQWCRGSSYRHRTR
jgi:hypothetical protein